LSDGPSTLVHQRTPLRVHAPSLPRRPPDGQPPSAAAAAAGMVGARHRPTLRRRRRAGVPPWPPAAARACGGRRRCHIVRWAVGAPAVRWGGCWSARRRRRLWGGGPGGKGARGGRGAGLV